ncbi:MAG: efflux RND transporter permease subunit [Desulfobacteraceae bacterium]|nr:efflux RND transporter permease subunit [Desulfobacteraceae bacterium]MBC2755452.1 efflux RND transporter permease subunit [Desulfobacteraceae bacterium]
MIVSDMAVKNRVSVVILAIIILFMGVYCYQEIPREDEPDITIPHVFVSTTYKGVAASDIETAITIQIEKKLKGLERVKNIKSVSSEGVSSIDIEFIPGTNIDDVLQKVKDKVDEAKRELPRDLEDDPVVFEVNLSELPIVVYSLSGTCGMVALKRIADDLEEDIESIAGVLEVDITGGQEREIIIEVDPDKLSYYRIPITSFQQVVAGENTNTSGGAITLGDGRFQVRVPGEFVTPDEIYGLVVTSFNGRPVYLKDLATVVDGFKDEDSRSRLDGRDAVNIAVKKRAGENIIEIVEAVDQLIKEQKPGWPSGTEIIKLMNKAKGIRLMLADLENNILSGLLLVVVVLLFALGPRNASLVGLAIPFSMFLSFMVIYAMGITLNIVVLFSLTLALGMLVDNAIVIVENIYRYMEQGVPRIDAAMRATSEVAYPVIGSTLTTLAAFFPMIFWPGIMGEFMKYLPITLIITLASSLFVAMVINPALAAFFMKVKNSPAQSEEFSTDNVMAVGEQPIAIAGKVLKTYRRVLEYSLQHRLMIVTSAFLFLIILMQIWKLVIGLEKPVEFFPSLDPKSAYVNLDPPEGADIDYMDRVIKKIELAVNNYDLNLKAQADPDLSYDDHYARSYTFQKHEKRNGEFFDGPTDIGNIEHIYATAKKKAGSSLFSEYSDNRLGIQFVDFEDRKTPSAVDIELIRERIKDIPGARITVAEEKGGPPTGAPINIEISGDDLRVLGEIARQVRGIISKIPFVKDVKDDYMDALPSVQIDIDRQKAAMFGLSTNLIGFALKTAYNGLNVSTYREAGEDYDITVKFTEKDRKVADVLRKIMIPSPVGQLVPLTTLATIKYAGSIGDINRINHERVVTVKAEVDETKVPGSVAKMQAEKLLKDFILPPGIGMKFTGQHEHEQESKEFLSKAFMIAIFLIFLILVTIFNSVSQPLIILTSVILSLGGVYLGLTVMRYPFGIIMSGVGVISLAGVVVNNAIVLIDYINKLRDKGMDLHDAIVAAGATRLRPVMLTAITTVLGLIPMATGISINFREMTISLISETSQYWKSMSIVVIFGLMLATVLTLVVVPTLYSLFAEAPESLKSKYAVIKKWYWKPFEKFLISG